MWYTGNQIPVNPSKHLDKEFTESPEDDGDDAEPDYDYSSDKSDQ